MYKARDRRKRSSYIHPMNNRKQFSLKESAKLCLIMMLKSETRLRFILVLILHNRLTVTWHDCLVNLA
jgi:hypothetical protein